MGKSVNDSRGVSYEEFFGRGKTKVDIKSANERRGVPVVNGPSFVVADEYKVCGVPTKRGQACKARPVGGHMVCVGHLKQQEAGA